MADENYRFAGTAFLLERNSTIYFVTARHVIDGIRDKGLNETYLRLNIKDGTASWFRVPMKQWLTHPNDISIDVAFVKFSVQSIFDHLVIPYHLCITERIMEEQEVGLGDEVFITGLFRHHYGNTRNIPIIRVGNVACLEEEKVSTRFGSGLIDAYLIEARSIGGLSGSPVFLNLGSIRRKGGSNTISTSAPIYLFGLIHGHYDTESTSIDEAMPDEEGGLSVERVNTGIATVVPFKIIDEVI